MENITLIGMPGAGKSTIGVVLAKIFNYQFIDSDLRIQAREGRCLSDLIEELGMEGFLDIEDDVNKKIEDSRCIIATGGSAVYNDASMKHLKSIGIVVYIEVSYGTLKKRLGNLNRRGVVVRNGYTLKDVYNERKPLYEKYADVTVNVDGLSMEEAIRKLVYEIKAYGNGKERE